MNKPIEKKEEKSKVPQHIKAFQLFRWNGQWAVGEFGVTALPKIILTDLLYDDALFEAARRNVNFARFERDEYGGQVK